VHREVVTAVLMSAIAVIPAWSQAPAPRQQQLPATFPEKRQVTELQGIVANLEKAQLENRQHYQSYTLVRDYKLFSGNDREAKSHVVARVRFVPPNRKTFTIDN